MINLKLHTTIADQVTLMYEGPGFYSGKTKQALSEPITLEKIAEEYMNKDDVYYFAKMEGYKVKPYKIGCCSEIPSNWEIIGNSEFDDY